MSDGRPICDRSALEGLTARALVAIAVRAARRTLLEFPPRATLKRHQRMIEKMHKGLDVAEEFVAGADCSLAFLRKAARACHWAGEVEVDVRFGPNQLELETTRANPAESVLAAVASALRAAETGLAAQMGYLRDSESSSIEIVSSAYEALRWGVYDANDITVAHRIGSGPSTDSGPPMDISDAGDFGPLRW